MLRKIWLTIWRAVFPYTAEEARVAYERAGGSPKDRYEAAMFEAVSWLINAKRNPKFALEHFEKTGGYPHNDLDYTMHERVHWWLSRWERQARHPVVIELPHFYM